MIGRDDVGERSAGGRGRQERAHRRVRKKHLAARADDGHGVLQMLDGRFQVRHLPGHLRPIGGQLRADRVEEVSQITELVVLIEIETDAELTLTEPRQAASNDVNRFQQQLREEHRHEHRDRERDQRCRHCRAQRCIEVVADEQRGDANANGAQFPVAGNDEEPLRVDVVAALAPIDLEELPKRSPREELVEIFALRQRLPFQRSIRVRDRDIVQVGHRSKGHVLRVQTRFENRSQARVGLERLVRIAVADVDLMRAVVNGVGEQLRAGLAFLEAQVREVGDVEQAQHHHHRGDDGGYAEDLLAFDAESHWRLLYCLFGRSLSLFNLL